MTDDHFLSFAESDWERTLAGPFAFLQLLNDNGQPTGWFRDFQEIDREDRHRQRPTGPADRKPDDKSWIKKDNRYTGGIRKRVIAITQKPFGRGMPRPVTLAQYQRHSTHLMSNILNLRVGTSPFTVVLDDLNQRATPFLHELIRRGLSQNVNVVHVSFEVATAFHPAVQHIPAWGSNLTGDEILQAIEDAMRDFKDSLVIVDSLTDLFDVKHVDMKALFGLVSEKYGCMLVGVYHQDITADRSPEDVYAPESLELVKYMATTVITCKSLSHMLAFKAAEERSLARPTHGLFQGAEGIVQCLDANDYRGIVLHGEFRRKSGRPESEFFFLREARDSDYNAPVPGIVVGTLKKEFVILLDQLPAYTSPEIMILVNAAIADIESTFNLGLTDKQKEAREGVVLPYFDAQKEEGGEGGRILYDMGAEDDFDEEEDEI